MPTLISRVRPPILDFIKIILVTEYNIIMITSIKATDPVIKVFFFIKSNIGDLTLEIWLKDEANVDG